MFKNFLDLGNQPLANSYLLHKNHLKKEITFNLKVGVNLINYLVSMILMILRISPKMPDFVRVQATRFWTERHYIPNWNFILKTRTMLIALCQHAISILCSSSS
jgi:hypothetical protein